MSPRQGVGGCFVAWALSSGELYLITPALLRIIAVDIEQHITRVGHIHADCAIRSDGSRGHYRGVCHRARRGAVVFILEAFGSPEPVDHVVKTPRYQGVTAVKLNEYAPAPGGTPQVL
jgi:hypothetical protein